MYTVLEVLLRSPNEQGTQVLGEEALPVPHELRNCECIFSVLII